MSFDCIWKCVGSDHKTWIDLRRLPADAFTEEYKTLGPFVVVMQAGGNYLKDEAFHFTTEAEARAFYAEGYRSFEYVGTGGPCTISLLIDGKQVEQKIGDQR